MSYYTMEQGRSSPSEGPEPGEQYRELANREGDTHRELSQKSRDAWASNDRAKAKEYSLAAKPHYAAMENYNVLAASEIFTFHNPMYSEDPQIGLLNIDLHGLRVSESLSYLEKHLVLCRRYGVEQTTIVTGKGLHSINGEARIKPQVEKILHEKRVRVVEEEGMGNSGAFVVELV